MKTINGIMRSRYILLICILQYSYVFSLDYYGGCIKEDPRNISWLQQVNAMQKTAALPEVCDNSVHLPPIRSQGSQQSCVAWAIGYYCKTYQEWQERGWDVNQPEHQFSPAFIYNQINAGQNIGTRGSDAMKVLLDFGCETLDNLPYNSHNHTSWPSEQNYINAANYRTQAGYWIDCSNNAGLNLIKQHLADGNIVTLFIDAYNNFNNISNYNNIYCVSQTSGSLLFGHAVTIVGYNDTLVTADGTGAFKLANSWGTNWGDIGYYWMSYEAVKSSKTSQQWAVYFTDRIGYQPLLFARIQYQHPNRNSVSLILGVGDENNMLWEKSFLDWDILDRREPRAIYWPNHPIVFDITDGKQYLNSSDYNDVFLKTWDKRTDGKNGSLIHFSLKNIADDSNVFGQVEGMTSRPVPFNPNKLYVTINPSDMLQLLITELTAISDHQTPNSVHLSWKNPVKYLNGLPANVDSIYLYNAENGILIGATNTENYEITNLINNKVYTIYVIALDNKGKGSFANSITCQIGDVLEPAYNLTANSHQNEPASIILTWNNPNYYQKGASVALNDITVNIFNAENDELIGSTSEETFVIRNLIIGKVYSFYIVAVDNKGNGGTPGPIIYCRAGGNAPGDLIKEIELPNSAASIAWDGEHVIIFDVINKSISTLDITLNNMNTISSYNGNEILGTVYHSNSIWVNEYKTGRIVEYDTVGQAISQFKHKVGWNGTSYDGCGLAWDGNWFWICEKRTRNSFHLFDTSGNKYKTVYSDSLISYCRGLEWVEGQLWVIDGRADLIRIFDYDGADNLIQSHCINTSWTKRPWDLTYIENAVLICDYRDSKLYMLSANGNNTVVKHDNSEKPVCFKVLSNYPNPFNNSTMITYSILRTEKVNLEIYNLLGQKMITLIDEIQKVGEYSIGWNGLNENGIPVASAVYFLKMKAGNFYDVKKMMLIR